MENRAIISPFKKRRLQCRTGLIKQEIKLSQTLKSPSPRDYKTFFMLNSAEHEIRPANKYENVSLLININLLLLLLAFSYLLAEKFSCSAIFSKKEFAIVSNLARSTSPTDPVSNSAIFLSVKMQNKKIKHRLSKQYLYFHKITDPTLFFSGEENRKIKKKFLLPTDQIVFSIFYGYLGSINEHHINFQKPD